MISQGSAAAALRRQNRSVERFFSPEILSAIESHSIHQYVIYHIHIMHTCSCSGTSVLSILSATRSGTVGSSDSQSFRMQQCVFDQVDNWIQIYTTMHGLPPPPFFEFYFCTVSKLSITVRASLPEWRAAAGHLHALRWGQLFQHREWRHLEHNFFNFFQLSSWNRFTRPTIALTTFKARKSSAAKKMHAIAGHGPDLIVDAPAGWVAPSPFLSIIAMVWPRWLNSKCVCGDTTALLWITVRSQATMTAVRVRVALDAKDKRIENNKW